MIQTLHEKDGKLHLLTDARAFVHSDGKDKAHPPRTNSAPKADLCVGFKKTNCEENCWWDAKTKML
jgi:hypothetical protein